MTDENKPRKVWVITDKVKTAQITNYIFKYGRTLGDPETIAMGSICAFNDVQHLPPGIIVTYPRLEAEKKRQETS